MKGTFTEAAIAATAHAFQDAAVCSVQNGIGNEELIAEHVPRVMRGVTLPAARAGKPGRGRAGRFRHDLGGAVRAEAGRAR